MSAHPIAKPEPLSPHVIKTLSAVTTATITTILLTKGTL